MIQRLAIETTIASTNDIPLIYQLAKEIWQDHYLNIITQDQINYMMDLMYSEEALIDQMTLKSQRFLLIKIHSETIGFLSYSINDIECFLHKFYIKTKNQEKNELVHTNDATAFALSRILAAITENYQNEDGSIRVPDVLQKYMGGRQAL